MVDIQRHGEILMRIVVIASNFSHFEHWGVILSHAIPVFVGELAEGVYTGMIYHV